MQIILAGVHIQPNQVIPVLGETVAGALTEQISFPEAPGSPAAPPPSAMHQTDAPNAPGSTLLHQSHCLFDICIWSVHDKVSANLFEEKCKSNLEMLQQLWTDRQIILHFYFHLDSLKAKTFDHFD